jgi:hypothetical protein
MIKSNFTQNYAVGFFIASITFIIVLFRLLRSEFEISSLIFVFLMAFIFFITTFFKNLPYYSSLVETRDSIIANHFFYHHQTIYMKDIKKVSLCGCQMRGGYELTISFFDKHSDINKFIFYSPAPEEIENFIAIMKNKGFQVIIDSNHEKREKVT